MSTQTRDKTPWQQFLVMLLRTYTRHTPLDKGRYRLMQFGVPMAEGLAEKQIVTSKDGRKFRVDLSTGMQSTVYFLGEYEPSISRIVSRLVRSGDTCLDVGANFGWYATLFGKLVGVAGTVHAFEPLPPAYDQLIENVKLNALTNVFANQFALTDAPGEFQINVFPDLPQGHASLSDHGDQNTVSYLCRGDTFDHYIEASGRFEVDLMKVDVEGGELAFLKGASRLLQQEIPPTILMEMALATSKYFGYVPDDLLTFLSSSADYEFFVIDERSTKLRQIDAFGGSDPGGNVICLPRTRPEHRNRIEEFIDNAGSK